MSLDRQIVRVMAAMILAIIAYAAPSAVQAHAGHAHHGHHRAAAPMAHTAPSAAKAVPAAAEPTVRSETPTWSTIAPRPALAEGVRVEPTRDECGQPGCKTRCCGTTACCVSGVPPGATVLSPSLLRTDTLIPRDVAGRLGPGPEALSKPPRTLA